jgi:hemerythrin-like domain-containing protein
VNDDSPRGQGPFLPRRMGIDAMIKTLVDEHVIMNRGLYGAGEAIRNGDFEALKRVLVELDPVFRQHIVDEESTILRLLIEKLGKEGAKEEIRVFQQHRPIYELMKRISEFASMAPSELEKSQEELRDLFRGHVTAEEGSVFPKAKSVSKG